METSRVFAQQASRLADPRRRPSGFTQQLYLEMSTGGSNILLDRDLGAALTLLARTLDTYEASSRR
jgi:hypothetical protein